MRQILLAIDGEAPSQPVFQYAADLCRQVRAELCILQFTRKKQIRQCLAQDTPGCPDDRPFSPVHGDTGAGLSGVSAPLKQMLKTAGPVVPIRVTLSAGSLETGLSDYIDTHHDIILTVYDPSLDQPTRRFARIKDLKDKLGVPLVIVRQSAGEKNGADALRT